MQNTFSLQLDKHEADLALSTLKAHDWVEEGVSTQYMVFKARSPLGSTAILYTSDKLVFQGGEDFDKLIGDIKNDHDVQSNFVPHIGVDEVGKGDYFGPLVVVACFLNDEMLEKVTRLGVGDSKRFADTKIEDMYSHMEDYPYYYVSIVHPEEYNQLTEEIGNASILLAKQHSKVIEMALNDLKKKNIECSKVVIDQFSSKKERILDELGELGSKTVIDQFHKGESDIAVATASVLARGVFLKEWGKMSMKYSFKFPKGASNVIEDGKVFVGKYGMDELKNVAKISFKTTAQISQVTI